MEDFNSHAHVERDPDEWDKEECWLNFNSHAHVERDVFMVSENYDFIDFNSHAHVERDAIQFDIAEGEFISTHTLTWSVTLYCLELNSNTLISTHTLTWSVTYLL